MQITDWFDTFMSGSLDYSGFQVLIANTEPVIGHLAL